MGLSTASRHFGRSAFTLVELLVVMSIIAVLVALLIPAIAKARQAALNMKCASQFRQMSIGFGGYTSDNRGFLTEYIESGYTGSSAYIARSGNTQITNHGSIYPYVSSAALFYGPDYEYASTSSGYNLADVSRSAKQFASRYKSTGAPISGDIVTTMQMPLMLLGAQVPAAVGSIYRVRSGKPNHPAISARLDENIAAKPGPILMDAQMWRSGYEAAGGFGGAHQGEAMHVLYADMSVRFVKFDWKGAELIWWHMGGSNAGSIVGADWNVMLNAANGL
jgi:prepilin-type N-terminal cleavage/methylation domain-containing protein